MTKELAPTFRRRAASQPQMDIDGRLRDVENALLVLSTQMTFLVDEAREQSEFRQRCYWAGGAAIALLVLKSIGFDVSVVP